MSTKYFSYIYTDCTMVTCIHKILNFSYMYTDCTMVTCVHKILNFSSEMALLKCWGAGYINFMLVNSFTCITIHTCAMNTVHSMCWLCSRTCFSPKKNYPKINSPVDFLKLYWKAVSSLIATCFRCFGSFTVSLKFVRTSFGFYDDC